MAGTVILTSRDGLYTTNYCLIGFIRFYKKKKKHDVEGTGWYLGCRVENSMSLTKPRKKTKKIIKHFQKKKTARNALGIILILQSNEKSSNLYNSIIDSM